MASTSSYPGPDGKDYWEVRWREGSKQPRSKRGEDGRRFRTEKQAKKYGEDREVLYRRSGPPRGQYLGDDLRPNHTVSQYTRMWFDSRFNIIDADGGSTRTPGSRRWTDGMVRNHIDGTRLGEIRLASLTKSDIEQWIGSRSKYGGGSGTLANSTLKMVVMLLRTILEDAIEDHMIDASPMPRNKSIKWPRAGESAPHEESYVPLSVEQVFDLADAFPARYRAMPLVQGGVGLRIGEVLSLRETDVCFGSCPEYGEGGAHIHVRWQFNDTEKQRGTGPGGRALPKSRHSRRMVPMHPEMADVLREHMAAFPPNDEEGSLFCKELSRRPHATGGPIGHQYYGQQLFKKAMRAAGLPDCSTHDLRHHYATELLAAGIDEQEVAKRLGHADAGLVISTYGHAKPGGADDVRAAMSASWAKGRKKADRHLKAVR